MSTVIDIPPPELVRIKFFLFLKQIKFDFPVNSIHLKLT